MRQAGETTVNRLPAVARAQTPAAMWTCGQALPLGECKLRPESGKRGGETASQPRLHAR